MPGKQIKPYIEEISLAFNPANKKKFILTKEGIMPTLVEILTSKDPMLKEKEVNAILNPLIKEVKLTEETADAIRGSLRILNAFKDGVPKGILSTLAKQIPEYAEFAVPVLSKEETDEAVKAAVDAAVKEAKEKFSKDEKAKIEAAVRKELEAKMGKDGDIGALQVKVQQLEKDVKDSKDESAASKKEAEEAKDKTRMMELITLVKEIGAVGDHAKHATTIFNLEKVDKKLADEHIESLKETAIQLMASGFFHEAGSSSAGDGAKIAYDKLKAKVDELKKEGVSEVEAWKRAGQENPALYKEYREGKVR